MSEKDMILWYSRQNGKKSMRSIDDDWNPNWNPQNVFAQENYEWIRNNAATYTHWSLKTAVGDTIKEKIESLMLTILDATTVVSHKIDRPMYFWAVTSPTIGSYMMSYDKTFLLEPISEPAFCGTLFDRIKIYGSGFVSSKEVLIGCGDILLQPRNYGRICIPDFG